jgi:hypothetical protein
VELRTGLFSGEERFFSSNHRPLVLALVYLPKASLTSLDAQLNVKFGSVNRENTARKLCRYV